MKVAYWNLRGSPVSNDLVTSVASEEKPDLFALAEHAGFDAKRLPAGYSYQRLSTRLAILSLGTVSIYPPSEKKLRRFGQVVRVDRWAILVCHLKSQLNDGLAERNSQMRALKTHLATNGTWERLVVIGDLNGNPWEDGFVDKESLHGLQTRDEAAAGLIYNKLHYPALINESYQMARPVTAGRGETWGTYKSPEAKLHSSLRWHLFDQVLVSSDVVATVAVRTEASGLPWYEGLGAKTSASAYPDHLPVVVELRER